MEISVKTLAEKTRDALKDFGLTDHTVWGEYCDCFLPVVLWHQEHGCNQFDRGVTEDFIRHIKAFSV